MKALMALAVAAAFAIPAYGAGDKEGLRAIQGAANKAEAMFKSMDKNNDGMVTKEEAKGTPYEKDFAKLDKNNDGKLSRDEHAAAPEHASKAAVGGTAKPENKTK